MVAVLFLIILLFGNSLCAFTSVWPPCMFLSFNLSFVNNVVKPHR